MLVRAPPTQADEFVKIVLDSHGTFPAFPVFRQHWCVAVSISVVAESIGDGDAAATTGDSTADGEPETALAALGGTRVGGGPDGVLGPTVRESPTGAPSRGRSMRVGAQATMSPNASVTRKTIPTFTVLLYRSLSLTG